LTLRQNKIQQFININTTTGYCAKCLKILDNGDKNIVKDVEGNEFCDRECKVDFYLEIKQDTEIFKNNE